QIDPSVLKEVETALLSADLGVKTTREILDSVREQMSRNALNNGEQLKREIKAHVFRALNVFGASPKLADAANGSDPRVIFVVGVNGAGKTTSIGKLANRLRQEGRSVVLCAADTFRAAAVEQLEIWAQRNGIDVIKQKTTAAGSAPDFCLITSMPFRCAQISNCSTAAARNVSAAQSTTLRPSCRKRLASFPMLVVFPAPFTPTIKITRGSLPFADPASVGVLPNTFSVRKTCALIS